MHKLLLLHLLRVHRIHLHVLLILLLGVSTHLHLLLRHAAKLPWHTTHGHLLHLQRINKVGFIQHIKNNLHIILPNATLLNDILHLEGINTHLLRLSNELFLQDALMHIQIFLRINLLPQAQLCLNLLPLIFLRRSRLNVSLLKEVNKLPRNLLECFLRKFEIVILELSVWNKLDNVTTHVPPVFLRVQWVNVGVQLVHGGEVSVTHTNYDDTERVVSTSDYLIDSLLQIIDDTIGDDEKNLITLVVVGDFTCLAAAVDGAQDL